jgi:transcriptional accessory protein Tex/SPT6
MTPTLDVRERELLLEEFATIRTQAAAAIALFDEGATLPFIARYRKERTRGLTETQLKSIQDHLDFHAALLERKTTILESIREQGALTADLERDIVGCTDRRRLEDLYLPHKPKRRTRAEVAREKGYGPLAELIWKHRPAGGDADALAGAGDILAERIATRERGRARCCGTDVERAGSPTASPSARPTIQR